MSHGTTIVTSTDPDGLVWVDDLPPKRPVTPRLVNERHLRAAMHRPGQRLLVQDNRHKNNPSGSAATSRASINRYLPPGFKAYSAHGLVFLIFHGSAS